MSSTLEITAVRNRWTDAINAGSVDAFVSCVTEDAIWLPPRGEAIQGAVALGRWLGELFAQFHYQFSIREEQVRLIGSNWAVEDARFRSILHLKSGEGEPLIHDGQYMLLWRRVDAGDWRIDRYIDRTDAVPAAEPR